MAEAQVILSDDGELVSAKTGQPPLSDREIEEFKQDCETVINELGAFVRVGKALRRIKDKKLYRADFGTFEECVKELFDLAARRAQQLMQTSHVMDLLDSAISQNAKNFSHFGLPKNEAQAAALLRAPEEKRPEVWCKTVEKYGEKVTARHIANVIREEGGAELEKKTQKAKRKISESKKEVPESFKTAFDAFWMEIRNAYLDDWKHVPKKEVVKHLEVVLEYVKNH